MWNILACMIQYLLSVDIIWNMIHIIWNGEKETMCGRIFDKISFWIKSLILDRLFFGGETSCTIIWQSKFLDKITCFGQIFLLLLWDALYNMWTNIWKSKFLDKITYFGQIFLLLLWDGNCTNLDKLSAECAVLSLLHPQLCACLVHLNQCFVENSDVSIG